MISFLFRWFLLFISLSNSVVESQQLHRNFNKLSLSFSNFRHVNNNDTKEGKRWAILVAGSRGYPNYRHQADVCHAYQILKKGGLKDDNIIVFMYDDIAFSESNPRKGIIINKPDGEDVYKGVPKDYTGQHVNMNNLFAVILGNKTGVTGGSEKVVDSGPNDRIFIFYADHGSSGLLGMPYGDDITAKDLLSVLKKKYKAKSYKSMVIYVEACESGSMFQRLLPKNLNIYAVTAANAAENSWGTYCPGEFPSSPPGFETCLGDLFSISWMEDSDIHNLRKETLKEQYDTVRRRTAVDDLDVGSHVMQYGDVKLDKDFLFAYFGSNPENEHYTPLVHHQSIDVPTSSKFVSQHEATLLHFWHKFHSAAEDSAEKAEAQNKLLDELANRKHINESMHQIITVLFGQSRVSEMLKHVQSATNPLVDDWDCFKMLVNTFKKFCGSTSRYEMKYSGVFANMCNAGVDVKQATEIITQACSISSFI